jgi:hypothetical protein
MAIFVRMLAATSRRNELFCSLVRLMIAALTGRQREVTEPRFDFQEMRLLQRLFCRSDGCEDEVAVW